MSSKLDYLKRYMSKEDGTNEEKSSKKKKKKSKTKSPSGFRIIDNDVFASATSESKSKELKDEDVEIDDTEDLFATQEEKPQIAGLVDERPAEIIMKEKFTTVGWQTNDIKTEPKEDRSKRVRHDSDDSPPRRRRHDSDNDSPPRRHGSDASPLRKRQNSDNAQVRKRHDSDDDSPSRKRHDSDASPPRRRHDSDASPPRRRHDSDASPPRRRHDSDASPPRRQRQDSDASPPRQRHDSDASPPRRQRKDSDASPPRKRSTIKQEPVDDDLSPPRPAIKREPDLSPARRIKSEPKSDDDMSPPRQNSGKLMTKTLSGKTAGLQNAKDMKEELLKLKRKEKESFTKLSSDVSGRDAETRVRGRLKEKETEERAKRENEEKLREELTKKYQKWNRGLKQLENEKARIEEVLHEMDKPLARSKDDADLDSHLREVDRMEDPMLAYIQKKKEKRMQATGSAIPQYPKYKGPEPPPNRFGIRPGYRWDGVDRSTGFEKKLFEKRNAKKAIAEEAFKWSTEDM